MGLFVASCLSVPKENLTFSKRLFRQRRTGTGTRGRNFENLIVKMMCVSAKSRNFVAVLCTRAMRTWANTSTNLHF